MLPTEARVPLGHAALLGLLQGEAALLRSFRSGYGQGYLFSRPVPAPAVDALLRGELPTPTVTS